MERADRFRLGAAGLMSVVAVAAMAPIVLSISTAMPVQASAQIELAPVERATYRLSQIGDVTSYRPVGPINGVALFLSGAKGWDQGVASLAADMTRDGIAVAGIPTSDLIATVERGGGAKCRNPNFALIALTQDYEHRLGLPRYIKPLLIGYGDGAKVTYGALQSAPSGAYLGAVSLALDPAALPRLSWCTGTGTSAGRLAARWIVIQGLRDQRTSAPTVRALVASHEGASLVPLPDAADRLAPGLGWSPALRTAIGPMLVPQMPASVGDLPLTDVVDPAAPRTPLMAVLYSGDGGWAGIDRDIASALARSGVPVAGFDSLAYFWKARTPAGAAADLTRVIRHFGTQWGRPRVVLVGYSFGADVLPFIVDQLPPDVRSQVVRISFAGLSKSADFQFHLANWIDIPGADAKPTIPAVAALKGMDLQCIRGADESDSACPALPAGVARQFALPGGHHFDGDADLVARTMLKGLIA